VTYDVIIVGAGGMGSAAACHLAVRGRRVLVLDRFPIGHEQGSSHGLTRIIRLAYFEDPAYVPLLQRAFELWRDLEDAVGQRLLHVTGSLDVGWEGSTVFEGSLRSCRAHGLTHEVLSGRELMARVPAWRLPGRAMAVWQPDGGFLVPERCVRAHLKQAESAGAVVRTGERVLQWQTTDAGVRIDTEQGSYEGGRLVLAAGAWMGKLVPVLARHLVVERQVVGWFEIGDADHYAPDRFPVFVLEADEGLFYGFPEFGVPGLKIGKYHHLGQKVDPDLVDRACRSADEIALREGVSRYLPGANGLLLRSNACLFTNTSDGHFVIDRHPEAPEVILVSACSGHGFKFCSVIGEIVADLVERGQTRHDISLFRLQRFGA
jgi:sarcosine oxidase